MLTLDELKALYRGEEQDYRDEAELDASLRALTEAEFRELDAVALAHRPTAGNA